MRKNRSAVVAANNTSPSLNSVTHSNYTCHSVSDLKLKSFPTIKVHRAALISLSVALIRHQPKLQVHGHGASVSHGVPVKLNCASSNLYCLVNRGMCVNNLPRLVSKAAGTQTCNSRLQVQRLNHYATMPHYTVSQKKGAFLFLLELCQISTNFDKFW